VTEPDSGRQTKRALWSVAASVGVGALAATIWFTSRPATPASVQTPVAQNSVPVAAPAPNTAWLTELRALLEAHRKVIVLLAEEDKLSATERAAANRIGHTLFHENQARLQRLNDAIAASFAAREARRLARAQALLDVIETDPDLFDADRLAFREVLLELKRALAADQTLPAIKLHQRTSEDLDALAEIERLYEKEMRAIFARFDTRAIDLKREKWSDYLAKLRAKYSREQILRDYAVVLPSPAALADLGRAEQKARKEGSEITGVGLPPKTLVLTFDDGPHAAYTDEILAILAQYKAPAIFFQVGRNLGTIDTDGKPKLTAARAAIAKRILAQGDTLANHSYSHAQLSKETGDALQAEIGRTDTLLRAVSEQRSTLFRFPYGARNREGLDAIGSFKLRSMMWNIDSLDWADPVPSSIADRVVRSVQKEGRGIVLFHDIHERTVKALPLVLEKLSAEGYRFVGWDGKAAPVADAGDTAGGAMPGAFSKSAVPAAPAAIETRPSTGYRDSWAVVVGIDEYQKWPKLSYAVRDAQAMRQTLIERFGFAAERVTLLTNEQATRRNILAAFHDKLSGDAVKRDDRIFMFYAGHGATRKLSSGRDLGYIVPVDADPKDTGTDAIPMSELQNIAESVSAKHVLFVMDACYSGLALTRGGASQDRFLRENARRLGRQMLTAGGADQLVADGGPGGHSIFTWTLLQALAGKGDLNGDGFITATELAAYIAPAVAGVSQQTPAFGSLPGSEGGEFVFELPQQAEFLSADSKQLPSDAIALNAKIEAARDKPAAGASIVVKDLQGQDKAIALPAAVPVNVRQQAIQANEKGLALFREKQYAQAETAFAEALKLRPDFALAANNLGFVYYRQDKFAEAARWFEAAIKMDPSRAVAYLNLGDAQAKTGDREKAKQAFKQYLELAPNGPGAAHAREQI
jgi:peptidoglycan/xylan/chitin deacetylase (PgdA/CDA1 family)/uncharacterized caspase-like protein